MGMRALFTAPNGEFDVVDSAEPQWSRASQRRFQTALEESAVRADMLSLFQTLPLAFLGPCKFLSSPILCDRYSLILQFKKKFQVLVHFLSPFPHFSLLCVCGAGHLEQPQPSSIKSCQKQHLECVVSGGTIPATSVYWCQERPGQANFIYLLHISSDNTVQMEPGITSGKSEGDEIPETSASALSIHSVGKPDSGTYYCAFWDVHSRKH